MIRAEDRDHAKAESLSPYDQLAREYYDERHRTSRNFDAASTKALASLQSNVPDGLILEPGCGRGRSQEYLGVDPGRVVQLDNSPGMLGIKPREACLVQVLHDAEELPFADSQFACVAAFLCDAFLGLNFLVEVRRVLAPDGLLIATTPSYEWGVALRRELGLDPMTTRFMHRDGHARLAPSHLYPIEELAEMIEVAGFDPKGADVRPQPLPEEVEDVSPDIQLAAGSLGVAASELPILYTVTAGL